MTGAPAVAEVFPGESAELQNFHELIRDVAHSLPGDMTPAAIAAAVIDKAGDALMSEIVVQLVAARVGLILGQERRRGFSNRPGRSSKLERRRAWWSNLLDSRVAVGDGNWRRLGDCSASDLMYCITEREDLITRTRRQIDNYHALIAAMDQHGAKIVGDLTPEQVTL